MAFVSRSNSDPTQWRSDEYRQEWENFLSHDGPTNLLDTLAMEQTDGEILHCKATVSFAQTVS